MKPMTISKLLMGTAVLAAVAFTSVADATSPDPSLDISRLSGEDLLVNLDLETEADANLEHEIGEADKWGYFSRRRRAPPAKQCYLKKTNGKDSGTKSKMKQRLDERRKGCVGYFTSAKPNAKSKRGCNIFGVVDSGFLGVNFRVTKKRCFKYCKSENPKIPDENACKDGCNYMRCHDKKQRDRGCKYSNPAWTNGALNMPTECKSGEEEEANAEVSERWGKRRRRWFAKLVGTPSPTWPKQGKNIKHISLSKKKRKYGQQEDEANLDLEEDAVCAIKACPPKCSLQNIKVGEEENVDQDVEADLQTMQKFGFVKKAVKAVVQWIKKKVCIPDAACISANQKCQATLDKLHASLKQLTSALAAAAAKASAAKGSSAAAAALAAQLDKQTAALKEVLKADTEAMEAAETEMTALKGQADQASADAKTANAALAAAVAKHAALVKVHQKSKQAALDAAAKAAGANSSAAKAAAAYKAAVAAHTDTAGKKAKVAAQLGM